jgi:hypothetical protein
MARSTLQALPETPVYAIGINFGFREELPGSYVVALFNDMFDAELEQQGWAIGGRKLVRKLTHGDDVLNLALTFGGEAVDFDFNFHSETGVGSHNAPLRAVEESRVLRLRDAALTILRETYHLELGDDDDGDGG